jgi:DNA-binding CsgD family transcriptional regulator
LSGIEALKMSDPQQLLGCCTALASYAAARVGRTELAEQLARDHEESTGMFVVVAHERAYLAACRHLLRPDAGGLEELLAQAEEAHANDSMMLELNALVLALELGEYSVAARVADVAAEVEGPWARGVKGFADALVLGEDLALIAAAEQLAGFGLLGLSHQALERAAAASPSADGMLAGKARKHFRRVASALGTETSGQRPKTGDPSPTLTRREYEVALLAADGLGDRETAEKLGLALRTVEGHLYRVYGKLGISARTELPAALARMPRDK